MVAFKRCWWKFHVLILKTSIYYFLNRGPNRDSMFRFALDWIGLKLEPNRGNRSYHRTSISALVYMLSRTTNRTKPLDRSAGIPSRAQRYH